MISSISAIKPSSCVTLYIERGAGQVDASGVHHVPEWNTPPQENLLRVTDAISGQRLTPNIAGTLDLDQHADAGVGADMGLLARQQQIEYGVVDRPALVQFGTPVEPQEAGVENAVAMRLEVGVDHANALVVAEVFQGLFLRALPIGEMVVVENDHAALGRDVGAVRALRRHKAWRAVIPGRSDERFEFFADGHEGLIR